jgi:hypothetical protein
MQYLDWKTLGQVSADTFRDTKPYPWATIPSTLTSEGYESLRGSLPDVTTFDRKVGVKRAYGQGSHDRAILHNNPSLQLTGPWKEFLAELEGADYQQWARQMLGLPENKRVIPTMEWYYAWGGCSVSPHCDARRKLATHIFYFNTVEDWADDWGGGILILDDSMKWKAHSAPSFEDLGTAAELDARGNASLLFERTEHSWHGVKPLAAPEGVLRKLFIVTLNVPTFQVWWRRVRGKDPDGFRLVAGS